MIDILLAKIKKGQESKHSNHIRKAAKDNKAFYTGKEDQYILWNYRMLETDAQKQQRDRITIRRPKHVLSQVEHTLDRLQSLDKAVINISTEKGKENDLIPVNEVIYNYNISQQAFDFVKYFNLVDANSFLICYVDDFQEPQFQAFESEQIFDFKIKNDRVDYLIIKYAKDIFRIYTQDYVVDYRSEAGKEPIMIEGSYIKTNMCYAFHLGYIKDSETQFQTFKTITANATELLKQLLWDGSEYDIIKALHGIIKQFAYAKDCNYSSQADEGYLTCNGGTLMMGGVDKGACKKCNGSGLRIHTSSQDIIYLPEPTGNDYLKLDQLTHTVFIPDSILTTRKEDLQEIENRIVRSIFNANQVGMDEIQKTATQVLTENSGIISQFHKMGNKVSECFIWMVECIADIKGIKNIEVFHGFSMDLNIDTMESLLLQRENSVKAGASMEVIKTIDRAILKKQHMDNPDYILRVELWESFRPFKNFAPNEKAIALNSPLVPDFDKVLYLNWDVIKTNITFANENFYELDRAKQEELIKIEVEKIMSSFPQVEPLNFDAFGA
jgi:hypothetical protein